MKDEGRDMKARMQQAMKEAMQGPMKEEAVKGRIDMGLTHREKGRTTEQESDRKMSVT